jgi:hypothetical protein
MLKEIGWGFQMDFRLVILKLMVRGWVILMVILKPMVRGWVILMVILKPSHLHRMSL